MSSKKKIYLHYEPPSGKEITYPFNIQKVSKLSNALEEFLAFGVKYYTNFEDLKIENLIVKLENGKTLTNDSKSTLLDILEDHEDLFIEILLDTISPSNSSKQLTKSESNVSSPSSSAKLTSKSQPTNNNPTKKPTIKPSSSSSSTSLANDPTSVAFLEHHLKDLIHKKQFKKIREYCESMFSEVEFVDQKIFLLKTQMEVHLFTERYDDVLKLGQRILSISRMVIEPYVLIGKALMAKSQFKRANDSFELALKFWQMKSVQEKLPNFIKSDFYYLDIIALQAQCTYELGEHQEAADLLNQVMNNPHTDKVVSILSTYAKFTMQYRKYSEAIVALLKAIAIIGTQNTKSGSSTLFGPAQFSADFPFTVDFFYSIKFTNNKIKEFFTDFLLIKEGFDQLLKRLPPTSRGTAEVYAYLASTVKEFSALDLSIKLYQIALQIQPNHAGYNLNLIHLYELKLEYEICLELIRVFCAKNLSLSIGRESQSSFCLSCADIIELLKDVDELNENLLEDSCQYQIQWKDQNIPNSSNLPSSLNDKSLGYAHVISTKTELNDLSLKEDQGSVLYTERELDLIALFATAVKILFLQGSLAALPAIIRQIENVRCLSKTPLHQTSIRNEMAYYQEIVHILCARRSVFADSNLSLANPMTSPNPLFSVAREAPIYILGDSHTLSPSWNVVHIRNQPRLLVPKLVTGVKQWHLRPTSKFYPKANFYNALASIPVQSDVVVVIGEIDCREGILMAVERDYYANIEEAMKTTIGFFVKVLQQIKISRELKVTLSFSAILFI